MRAATRWKAGRWTGAVAVGTGDRAARGARRPRFKCFRPGLRVWLRRPSSWHEFTAWGPLPENRPGGRDREGASFFMFFHARNEITICAIRMCHDLNGPRTGRQGPALRPAHGSRRSGKTAATAARVDNRVPQKTNSRFFRQAATSGESGSWGQPKGGSARRGPRPSGRLDRA